MVCRAAEQPASIYGTPVYQSAHLSPGSYVVMTQEGRHIHIHTNEAGRLLAQTEDGVRLSEEELSSLFNAHGQPNPNIEAPPNVIVSEGGWISGIDSSSPASDAVSKSEVEEQVSRRRRRLPLFLRKLFP